MLNLSTYYLFSTSKICYLLLHFAHRGIMFCFTNMQTSLQHDNQVETLCNWRCFLLAPRMVEWSEVLVLDKKDRRRPRFKAAAHHFFFFSFQWMDCGKRLIQTKSCMCNSARMPSAMYERWLSAGAVKQEKDAGMCCIQHEKRKTDRTADAKSTPSYYSDLYLLGIIM